MKKGGISVQTENIFPVIKKWLYSDKDIFLRELVSNACDAITKHKRLVSLSQADESAEPYRISVCVDKAQKTITVNDNGIGMSEEEVDKYINSIALSGAIDFISKYDSEANNSGIIGHFGLGFYSAFMVASEVEIETKSYTDAVAVRWFCKEDGGYEMEDSDRGDRGTSICLHVSESEAEYLDYTKIKTILDKYCAFMPYEIFCVEGEKEERVNPNIPAWQKSPSDVSDEEYIDLYKKLSGDYRDPVFWVHINADYPLNFKGILYFPGQKSNFEPRDGVIKLYYNSVFVADNIKEVVPEYLSCLCGALDCPELPLNVSRSYLQDDAYVRKLSAHIVKKVADRLCKLKNDDFEKYTALWDVVRPYMEYGCIRDSKFYERMKGAVIFKKTDGEHDTFDKLTESEEEKRIYYSNDTAAQAYYIKLLSDKGISVYVFDTVIDVQFASFLEDKFEKIKFLRVDSSVDDIGSGADDNEQLKSLFAKATGLDSAKISFASLGAYGVGALLKLSEESRRFSDMMRMYALANGGGDELPRDEELVVNTDSDAIVKIQSVDEEKALIIAKHVYYMAVVANRALSEKELKDFVETDKKLYSFI